MAKFRNLISADIDPAEPVREACAVINRLTQFHPGKESAILSDIHEAIGRRLEQLKGVSANAQPVRESDAE